MSWYDQPRINILAIGPGSALSRRKGRANLQVGKQKTNQFQKIPVPHSLQDQLQLIRLRRRPKTNRGTYRTPNDRRKRV